MTLRKQVCYSEEEIDKRGKIFLKIDVENKGSQGFL